MKDKADDTHTCSYYCERPDCIREQRNELRNKLIDMDQLRKQPAEKRDWKGLTSNEIAEITLQHIGMFSVRMTEAIEARLKARNT